MYLQQWKQDRKNNFSHMFSLLQVLTKKEQNISNHSFAALRKLLACLKRLITLHFLCECDLSVPLLFSQLILKLLAWRLKGGELVSKPLAENCLSPVFFLQSLKLISFAGFSIDF